MSANSSSNFSTLGVAALADGIRAGSFSSEEVAKGLLDAVAKNSDINAFITCDSAEILNQARAADQKLYELRSQGDAAALARSKPLFGVPVAVKDMILTKGTRTTAASKILSNFVPPYDATVVTKLKDAGAVIFGKTNLDEFAMGSSNEYSAFGAVKNPWNRSYVPGGSSGGSAAAVAAGLAPAALGTDTGGSIRQPASFTNTVGIKPTYGRVSRYGVVAFASSFDQVGTFTRSVEDAALMSEVLFGRDPQDSTSVDLPVPALRAGLQREMKGVRIGVPKEYIGGEGLSSEVKSAIEQALKLYESLGAKIVDISLPHTELGVATYYIIAPAEASSNLARYDGIRYGHRTSAKGSLEEIYAMSRGEGFGIEPKRRILLGSYVLSAGFFDAYYVRAQKCRTLVANDFREAFAKHCDVIAAPTTPNKPFKIGEKISDPLAMYLSDAFTIPVNLAGLPGMSIPCGFSSEGLPIGLQLIGKPFDEESLLATAAAYERNTEWHKKMPKLA